MRYIELLHIMPDLLWPVILLHKLLVSANVELNWIEMILSQQGKGYTEVVL